MLACASAVLQSPALHEPSSAPCKGLTVNVPSCSTNLRDASLPCSAGSLAHMVRLRCIWPRCKLSLETARSASSSRAASLPLLAPLASVL